MRNFSDDILDNTVGNIQYRNNVVTGIIAVDNGNNTYDVCISGNDTAYPDIPTTAKDPDFTVDDAVEVAINNGNKEDMVIIGYSQKIAQEFVEDEINVLVTTLDAYTIAATTAYLEGRVEDIDDYENVTRQGFYYGTSTSYGSDIYTTGSFAAGTYNKQATGLTASTTYHYQAYVYDTYNDVHTGEDKTMTTSVGAKIFVVYQVGSDFYLNSYGSAGTLVSEWGILSQITAGSIYKVHADSDNNVYIFNFSHPNMKVYKYDKDGTYISVTTIVATEVYSAISPNGYMYTLDSSTKDLVRKRNLSGLGVVDTLTLSGDYYYYLAFDSDGYAYLYDKDTSSSLIWGYVKYELGVGEVTKHLQTNSASSYDSWVVAGDYIGCSASQLVWDAYTIAKALNANRAAFTLNDITTLYKMSSVPNYFVCLGIDSGGKLTIEKYASTGTRQWKTEVIATGFTTNLQYCGVGSYPF